MCIVFLNNGCFQPEWRPHGEFEHDETWYIYIFTAMNHIDCHSCMSVIVYVYKMPNISYKKSKELLSTSSFSKIVTRKAHHYAIEQLQHSVGLCFITLAKIPKLGFVCVLLFCGFVSWWGLSFEMIKLKLIENWFEVLINRSETARVGQYIVLMFVPRCILVYLVNDIIIGMFFMYMLYHGSPLFLNIHNYNLQNKLQNS